MSKSLIRLLVIRQLIVVPKSRFVPKHPQSPFNCFQPQAKIHHRLPAEPFQTHRPIVEFSLLVSNQTQIFVCVSISSFCVFSFSCQTIITATATLEFWMMGAGASCCPRQYFHSVGNQVLWMLDLISWFQSQSQLLILESKTTHLIASCINSIVSHSVSLYSVTGYPKILQ